MKYQVIYADPPWKYGSKHYQDGGRDFNPLHKYYESMDLSKIKELPVDKISAKDSALFMWVTDSHLPQGIEVLTAWGFRYVTIAFVWVKQYKSGNFCYNFAPWTLKSSEICLLGIKGQMGKHKKMNNVKQLVVAERTEHSTKPQVIRERINSLFGDLPRIELFAREKVNGWDSWGNEVESDIKLM